MKRRTAIIGAVSLGAAGALARRRGGGKPKPASRAPIVSDEEFYADEKYIHDCYRTVDIDGWKTRIFDEGEGEAVVFIPIIKGLEVVYARQLRAFSKTHRALLYERDETLDKPVYVEERVDEIRRLLDQLGIERAHIVGLGDAGVPALTFGREHPDRVLTLTSINLGPRYRMPPYWLTEGVINPLTIALPIEKVVPDGVIRAWVVRMTAGQGALPEHLIRHMIGHIEHPMRVHKFSVMPVTKQHEMRDWGRTLAPPTLLIGRDDDPLAPVSELQELAALLPNCHGVHVLPDGGRFVTYTWAERVEKMLRDFFAVAAAPVPPASSTAF